MLLHELDCLAADWQNQGVRDTLGSLELKVVALFVIHKSVASFVACLWVFNLLIEKDGLVFVLTLLGDELDVGA